MGSDIALAVVGKIVEKTVDPVVNTVVRQCSYIFCYKQNIQTLGDDLALLEARREGVQLSMAEAERNLEIVDPTVKVWLTKVDDIKSKAMAVDEGTSNVGKGCLNGWCPNLKHRYLLSRRATKLTASIGKLKGEGDKDAKFAHPARPIGIISSEAPYTSPMDDGFKEFATRITTMNELMDALKDDGINLIGISGMGGIGKTTLVKQALEKVKAESLFNEVAMTVVSQQPDLVKIQGEIAGMLGLKFDEGPSVARAERLSERLKKGGRVLVILDDIWEGINLSEVGIPVGKGCRVLFTTRIERACIEMKAQRHITVQILSHQEAWDLFREAAGDCVEDAVISDIAKEVAKECGGLPIAVVTLGKALSKRKKYEWEDTRLKLKKSSGMDERVQSSIRLSYDFLESRSPQAQPLLLLCTLFQEDQKIPIEQLVKYSMGLESFDDVETLEETRNRVHCLLINLKSCNLVLQGDDDEHLCVKLHDVVRDVCMSIVSNSPYAYLVRHAKELKQWPQQNRHKADHTAIALKSGAMKVLPGGLDHPNLRLLQLQLGSKKINIAGEFFLGMGGLQVFNFDGTRDEYWKKCNVILPQSLGLLTNLQALSLENCILGGDVSSIGCLKGLKILSFYSSLFVVKFPSAVVGELKNLKLLDLRFEYNGRLKIEASLLSGLDQLEVLYLGKYEFSSIKELNSLSCLTTLQICIDKSTILLELEEPFFEKLKRFDIHIGGGVDYSCGEYGIIRNNITLVYDNLFWVSHTKLCSLLRRIQSFYLGWLREDQLIWGALSNLEILKIAEMKNLREISPGSQILQELHLRELAALKHLWRGPTQPPSFANLRLLSILFCDSIESLFSPDVAKCMLQLEWLYICHCDRLKGVVVSNQGKADDDKGFEKIYFPKLKTIILEELRDLKCLYPEPGSEDLEGNCGTKQTLFNQWVSFPSLEEIRLSDSESIERIVGYQMQDGPANNLRSIDVSYCSKLKNFVNSTTLENLEEVHMELCDSMEVVFDLEGLKVGAEDSPFVFDKLKRITLSGHKNLAHVWRMAPDCIQGFRNLTTLGVKWCDELRYLMSYSVAKMLVNLQVLKVEDCGEIVGVIEEGENVESSSEAKLRECVVFPQLEELVLVDLKRLTSFCSNKCSLEFQVLNKVEIRSCPEMKSFCGGEVKAPSLKEPVEDPNGGEWFWEGNLNNGIYREKREVEVEDENKSDDDEVETEDESESE